MGSVSSLSMDTQSRILLPPNFQPSDSPTAAIAPISKTFSRVLQQQQPPPSTSNLTTSLPSQPVLHPYPTKSRPDLVKPLSTKLPLPLFSKVKRPLNASPSKSTQQQRQFATISNSNAGRSGIHRLTKSPMKAALTPGVVAESRNYSLKEDGRKLGAQIMESFKRSDNKTTSHSFSGTVPPVTRGVIPAVPLFGKRQPDNTIIFPAQKRPKIGDNRIIPAAEPRRRYRQAIGLSSFAARIPHKSKSAYTLRGLADRSGGLGLSTGILGTSWLGRGIRQSSCTGSELPLGDWKQQLQETGGGGNEGAGTFKAFWAVRVPLRNTIAGNAPSSIPRLKSLSPTKSNPTAASRLPPPLRISTRVTAVVNTTTPAVPSSLLTPFPTESTAFLPPFTSPTTTATTTTATAELNFTPPSTLHRKVAILHERLSTGTSSIPTSPPSSSSTLSITLRNKLDYSLSRFTGLPRSCPITTITMKEFLGFLLCSRQLGRMTGHSGEKSKVALLPAVSLIQQSANTAEVEELLLECQEVLWEGRRL